MGENYTKHRSREIILEFCYHRFHIRSWAAWVTRRCCPQIGSFFNDLILSGPHPKGQNSIPSILPRRQSHNAIQSGTDTILHCTRTEAQPLYWRNGPAMIQWLMADTLYGLRVEKLRTIWTLKPKPKQEDINTKGIGRRQNPGENIMTEPRMPHGQATVTASHSHPSYPLSSLGHQPGSWSPQELTSKLVNKVCTNEKIPETKTRVGKWMIEVMNIRNLGWGELISSQVAQEKDKNVVDSWGECQWQQRWI